MSTNHSTARPSLQVGDRVRTFTGSTGIVTAMLDADDEHPAAAAVQIDPFWTGYKAGYETRIADLCVRYRITDLTREETI